MSAQLEISLPQLTAATPVSSDEITPPQPAAATRVLTEEQQEAVARRHGSLLLSAGAGSGKTSVLVERFVRAVIEDDIAPSRILAITFTERSAGELAERIRRRFGELGQRELARDTEAAFLGTFHGFAARLLRAHSLPAGLDPDFAILDEAHAGRLRLDAFRGALADFLQREGSAAVDLLAAFSADRLRAAVLDVYAQLRSQGQAQPGIPPVILGEGLGEGAEQRAPAGETQGPGASATESDREGARACALIDTLLRGFSGRYAAAKSQCGSLDFDDLELFAASLLHEHPHVRAAFSERFQLLMVDEFQDTNPRQLAILAALERDNLFTVGDELQSIYGFRHADVELFRARRSELALRGSSLALTHSFRSTPALLAAINAVFATRFGEDHVPLLPGCTAEGEGSMASGNGGSGEAVEGTPIELLLTDQRAWNGGSESIDIAGQLPPAPRWRQAEARLLAQRLADIVAAGEAQPGDIAVLLRALSDLPLYQRALEERGLPTLASVGSFWGHQQVGDLLAYLRALANPLDEVALYSVLASPLVGLSSDALAHIALTARSASAGDLAASCGAAGGDGGAAGGGVGAACGEQAGVRDVGVWDMLRTAPPELRQQLAPAEWQRLTRFRELFLAERAQAAQHPIAELLRRGLHLTGYHQHLLSLPFGARRLANVHKLLRLAHRFEAQEGRQLRGFLDHIDHQLQTLEQAEPLAPVADGHDAVRLMTIHAAKGLEFPLVALADLGRRPAANRSDLLIHGPRVGLRLAQLDGSPAVPTLAYDELLAERRLAEAHEEHRILYVALTRARQRLILSGALDFSSPPADAPGAPPLAWLLPALHPHLPALAAEALEPQHEIDIHGAPAVRLRLLLNTPATLGSVLRPASLHPNAAPRQEHIPPLEGGAVGRMPTSRAPRPSQSCASAQPDRRARPTLDPLVGSLSKKEPQIALSYTALSELERCGYRYYLERLLHLPPRPGDGTGGRLRGRILHRLLQDLDFARPFVQESDVARAAAELGVSLTRAQQGEIAGLLGGLAGSDLATRLAAAPLVHREHPFAFSSPAPISGVFDLLLPGEHCLVVDYKSDAIEPHEDLAELVHEHYGAQRLIYALAALRHGALRVEIVHWFLARPHEPVSASFSASDLARLQAELDARVASVRQRGFTVSPTPHRELCLTCPARGTLCSWDDAATMRAHPPSLP